ncbi:cysteine-rich CWC family protein [Roseivirga pacifica]|uniref:cysteine-rich CWC family protein n=1 Tax=Roseivirga pacifica TaxID=1267423 RepID=UPI00227BF5BA|nr:cysteine-rich CWC family protein [Roseivirga pacifica]
MPKHEERYCPRCKALFECKVGSISLCQCSTVVLTPSQKTYVSELFNGCLCANCLKQLQTEHSKMEQQQSLKRILGPYYKNNDH